MSYSPPPGFVFVHQTRYGTAWFMRSNGPYMEPDWLQVQDTEKVLDRNQAMANHNDGWSVDGRQKSDKLLKRVATVPWAVIEQWRQEGLEYFSTDPDVQRKITQRLNSREWFKLRTSEGSV